jgi:hypothetical protein
MQEHKQIYYISLHSSIGTIEIRDHKGETTYDFVIKANEDEITQMEKLVSQARSGDLASYIDSHIVPFSNHVDQDNQLYDRALNQLYHMIYQLGTEETKRQMEEMKILDALKGSPGETVRWES